MKLFYNQYETAFLDSSYFNFVAVEGATEFYNIQYDLEVQMLGEKDKFILSENGNILPFQKSVDWITNIWNLDINSRKMTTKLYDYLSETLRENGLDLKIFEKWNEIEEIIEEAFYDEPSVVFSKEFANLPQVMKSFEVKLDDNIDRPLFDRIIDYCSCKIRFEGKIVFIFNQLLAYLKNNDIIELGKYCSNEKVYILILDKYLPELDDRINGRFTLIDEDLCDVLICEP